MRELLPATVRSTILTNRSKCQTTCPAMIPNRHRPDQAETDDLVCRPASLAETVAQALIRALETGRFKGQLPGERKLGVMLQVSRMTLRPALQELERLGWIRRTGGVCRECHRLGDRRPSNRQPLSDHPSAVRR